MHWLHPLQRVPEGGLEGRAQGDLPQAQDLGRRPAWREYASGTYIITNMRNDQVPGCTRFCVSKCCLMASTTRLQWLD
jgi:hypothetical protein